MEFKYVREAQMAMLEMAKVVDGICRKHNITYWITTGSVLGAVRNKGFIKWDDDLDMCFLIDDYHRMIKALKEEVIPNHPHYILYNDHRPFPHTSEFLADTRIVRDFLYPIKIDLARVKSLPNTPEVIQEDRDRVNLLGFISDKLDTLNVQDKTLVQKHLLEGPFFFKRDRYINNFIAYVDGLNKVDENHVYSNIHNDIFATTRKGFNKYSDIFPVKEIEFEGHMFYGPNDVDAYLTVLYGKDYINPPPVEQRVPFSNRLGKSIFPKFMSKVILRTLYTLKAVKASFTLNSKIKKNAPYS